MTLTQANDVPRTDLGAEYSASKEAAPATSGAPGVQVAEIVQGERYQVLSAMTLLLRSGESVRVREGSVVRVEPVSRQSVFSPDAFWEVYVGERPAPMIVARDRVQRALGSLIKLSRDEGRGAEPGEVENASHGVGEGLALNQ